jgi:hypothetical protein
MSFMKSLKHGLLAAVLLSAGAAQAALLQFNVTGDYSASWQMESDRIPEEYIGDVGVVMWEIAGNYAGSASGIADIGFFNGGFGGGLSILDLASFEYLLVADGPQIYSGTEVNPLFAPGTFVLTQYEGAGSYLLIVTEVAQAAVPEPATGALLLGGLALMAASRNRRKA